MLFDGFSRKLRLKRVCHYSKFWIPTEQGLGFGVRRSDQQQGEYFFEDSSEHTVLVVSMFSVGTELDFAPSSCSCGLALSYSFLFHSRSSLHRSATAFNKFRRNWCSMSMLRVSINLTIGWLLLLCLTVSRSIFVSATPTRYYQLRTLFNMVEAYTLKIIMRGGHCFYLTIDNRIIDHRLHYISIISQP